jgi:cytoskeletal protein CcmA (bactofilin family)
MSQSQNGAKQTLIEEGTKFTGSFASNCPIVVRGAIEGEISGPSLTVSTTGAVSGKVKVKELHSEGSLSGEYDADVVQLSGTVKDKTIIRTKQLEVRLTPERGRMQVVFGECELEVGDVPSKEQAVADARSTGTASPATAAGGESTNGRTDPPPPMEEIEDDEAQRRKGKKRPNTMPPGAP